MPEKDPNYRRRRRRMSKFVMTEISAVDRPAQEGAIAVIAKRHEPEDVNKRWGDMADALTSSVNGHQHGVDIRYQESGKMYITISYAQASGEEMSHDHEVMVDGTGNFVVSENAGHAHELDTEMIRNMLFARMANKRLDEASDNDQATTKSAAVDGGGPDPEDDSMSQDKNAAKAAGDEPTMEQLQADLKKANARAELTDAQKAYYTSLSTDAEKDAFLNKSADERAQELDMAKSANPVVYKSSDGTEYIKNDDARMVKMAKERDEDREALRKSQERADRLDLEKRAETELGAMPGDMDTRVALLKAVDGIEDEAVRKSVKESLTSKNDSRSQAFRTIGSEGVSKSQQDGDGAAAADELDTLTKNYMKENNVDYYTAYEAIGKQNPVLLQKAINA